MRHSAGILVLGTLLGTGVPGTSASAQEGLAGQWTFDGSDGQAVRDRSPLGNDGSIEFGELRRELGTTALELGGLGACIRIELKQRLTIGDAITTMLWVNPYDLRRGTVLFGIPHVTPSWTTPVFGMYVNERRVVYGMWLDGNPGKVLVESPDELPQRAWSCLAATYDGALVRLFVDGAMVASAPATGRLAFNDQPLLIGRGLGSKPSLRGRVGELRLYARALSPDDIRDLYEQTKGGYDLTKPVVPPSRDGTAIVETHGNSPAGDRPWRQQPTRLLELLDGFRPGATTVLTDAYGGRTDGPAQTATGFFYTRKIDGRHWFVDPLGNRFFHVGLNAVREPRRVEAIFGSADQWAVAVTAQLRAAGFNGLGNWHSPRLAALPTPLVWVLRRDFMFAFAREKGLVEPAAGTQGFTNRCMPVFHPEFEAFCDRYAKGLTASAQNPHLLGIMTDNELQCPVDLLDRCLAVDPTASPDLAANRAAAEAWLAARRVAGQTGEITLRDRYQFIAHAFERYYRIVRAAVRTYDPNHLYLGSRINYAQGEFDNPWFWRALAPYHDVVSVNYYGNWGPDAEQFAQWAEWADKPILITEWYAKAEDVPGLANTHGAGWLVHTQEDRGRYYQHFALAALEIPGIVGWHYFKYLDDPAESKALDSAGGANKGLCGLDGTPYAPLLERARAVNVEVYPLRDFFAARRPAPPGR